MSIHVRCEGCGKVLSVPDGSEGRTIQCARCGMRMRVPNQAPQTAAEPAEPRRGRAGERRHAGGPGRFPQSARRRGRARATPGGRREGGQNRRPKPGSRLCPKRPPAASQPQSRNSAARRPPTSPAMPPPKAPCRRRQPRRRRSSGGMPEDKDAFFKALAERGRARATRDGRREGGPKQAPKPSRRLRPKRSSAADQPQSRNSASRRPPTSPAMAVAEGPVPPRTGHDMRPHPLRKLIGAAVGLLLLIVIIISDHRRPQQQEAAGE